MRTLSSGTRLKHGTYRIEQVLGQGSFGITYLATAKFTTQGSLGKMEVEAKVAIKEFFMSEVNARSEDGSTVEGSTGSVFANYRKKFRKEAENLSRLSHPNIVTVFDVFDENNTTYYVMEFLEGQNLDDYIRRHGSIEESEAIKIISEIGNALAYMHSRKMLHLDIKPKNIMIKPDGKGYLIDFGLSKQFTENGEPETSTSIGLGTSGYAPIEQAGYKQDGSFPATLDVYALGATMYKMLTGKRPPEASYILNDGFPENELRFKRVSDNTRTVLKKAMATEKRHRFQSVKSFIDGLEEDVTIVNSEQRYESNTNSNTDTTVLIPPPPPPPDPEKPDPKPNGYLLRWTIIGGSVAVLVMLAVFLKRKPDTPAENSDLSAVTADLISSTSSQSEIINNLLNNMVYVEGGSFTMGSDDPDAYSDEKPAHIETVGSFSIGKYEVTQREWKAVMGNNPSKFKGDDLPVENVSWEDCQQFISKLNALTGRKFRLPSESEWEFAARGGKRSNGYKYSGGNDIDNVAWYEGNSGGKTHPVGTKRANELGLHDMSGNVWEWTSSNWCDDYSQSRDSSNLVSRGGSWFSSTRNCRVSNRGYCDRTYRNNYLGLRLVF